MRRMPDDARAFMGSNALRALSPGSLPGCHGFWPPLPRVGALPSQGRTVGRIGPIPPSDFSDWIWCM